MQCPIGNAATGYAVGEIKAVKLSKAMMAFMSITSRFCWKMFLQNGKREGFLGFAVRAPRAVSPT